VTSGHGGTAGGGGSVAQGSSAPVKPLQFTAQEVVRPQMTTLPTVIEFSGPLVAPATAIVRAKSSGTLLSLVANEGVRVRAGETIGSIDLADLRARLAEKLAQVESAQALLVQAQRTHASNQRLAAEKFISPIALDNSLAALDTARAQLSAAKAQADTVRVSLRDAALVAPISGVVAKRYAVPGEKLSADQQIVSIVDLRNLELAGTVSTYEVSSLRAGMPVEVKIEGMATPYHATLARIAPSAEAGTRSIGVTVAMANPTEALRAGQYGVARVTLPGGTPKLVVPISALATASGQDYVWTVEQGKLVRRTVTTGRRDAARGLVEVLEGLPAGTQVLAARFDNLREGAEALVGTTATAASAASAADAKAPSVEPAHPKADADTPPDAPPREVAQTRSAEPPATDPH
jgi:RND family efflux transporter MFP subunit